MTKVVRLARSSWVCSRYFFKVSPSIGQRQSSCSSTRELSSVSPESCLFDVDGSIQDNESGAGHFVSKRRMREFIDAEATHFAAMPRKPLSLGELLAAAESPRRLASYVHKEIPKRFAGRLKQIEDLPAWQEDDDLSNLHGIYLRSFLEVRLADPDDLEALTVVVRRLKDRQTIVFPKISTVIRNWRESDCLLAPGGREQLENWVQKFLRGRVTTEMLTAHYLAIIDQVQQGETSLTGIVDPKCDPAVICHDAAEEAKKVSIATCGIAPCIDIEVRSRYTTSFSFTPMYLHRIVYEILRFSCQKTALASLVSTSEDSLLAKSIHVVICADDYRVAIRVRDIAGGVPFEDIDCLWNFLSDSALPIEEDFTLLRTSLGLPFAKLMASYLGGQLSLMSLPGYGADIHLLLPRIDIEQGRTSAAEAAETRE